MPEWHEQRAVYLAEAYNLRRRLARMRMRRKG